MERTSSTSSSCSSRAPNALSLSMAVGILLLVLGRRELQPGLGLLERDAGLKSSGSLKVVALVGRLRVDLERDVELRRRSELAEVEFGPDDADDDVRFAAELDGLADNLTVGIEATHPQRMTHHRDMRRSGRSSAAVNGRPITMGAPKSRKYSADTCSARSCSGSPAPVRLTMLDR